MKYFKKWSVIIILYIIVIFSACGRTKKEESLEFEEKTIISDRVGYLSVGYSQECEYFYVEKEGTGGGYVIPGKYLIDRYAEWNEKGVINSSASISTIKEFDVYLLDIHTLETVKTIDMMTLFEPYLKDWQIRSYIVEKIEENYYLRFWLKRNQTEEELKDGTSGVYDKLYIDPETEEVIFVEEGNVGGKSNDTRNSENIGLLTGSSILTNNGLDKVFVYNSVSIEDTTVIQIPTKQLATNNKKLYHLFPGLKEVNKEDDTYVYIYLTPKLTTMEALSFILDDEEELDFTVLEPDEEGYYGGYSLNGKSHKITEEEYQTFQKEYWEYRKQQHEEWGTEREQKNTESVTS